MHRKIHPHRAASCSVSARIAQRRVELAAARLLPSSESPTLPEDRIRTAGAARTVTLDWDLPRAPAHAGNPRTPAAQTSQGPGTPWRPTCGSGQSPDAARAPSRHFTQEKREARSCNSKSGRPVAAAVTHEPGELVSQKNVFHPPTPPPSTPPYVWRISHAKWNLLRKIEHGNTTTTPKVAADLRLGHKIAVWWQGPGPANSRWYTARVLTAEVKNGVLTHTVLYDSDKSRRWTHALMPQSRQPATGDFSRWIPAPPTSPLPAPDVAAPREAARAPR